MSKKFVVFIAVLIVALSLAVTGLIERNRPPYIDEDTVTPETETPAAYTVEPVIKRDIPTALTPPADTPEPDPIWEAQDIYRAYIASVIFMWDDMTLAEQQEAREYILENGIAYMDEPTARWLGLWDGYDEKEPPYTDRDVDMLAKMVWGEARGCTPDEWRLTVWTVLQRVDAPGRWGDTIEAVLTAPSQFMGYRASFPVDPAIRAVVEEVLADWAQGAEPLTHELYAPTAPYFYFDGDGRNNYFREVWR